MSNMQHIARRLVFIFILLHLFVAADAQSPELSDSTNFITYFDKTLIKANISSQTDQYVLRDKNGADLKLRANNEFKTFLSLDYEFIGFSYGFAPKFLGANNDNDLKGHSSFNDFKLQLLPGKWLQTLSFKKTRGYYVENTGDFVLNWKKNKDPYLQIESLKIVQWAGSTSFVFNKNFSFKNLIYQTQWQKRSAGSFVPTLYYDRTLYAFDLSGSSAQQRDINLRLGLGYYYTFIIAKKFYVAPNLVPAIGFSYSKSESVANGISTSERKTYFTNFLDGGLKFGFNSDKWIAGGGINFNINWYREEPSTVIENDRFFGIIYIGYRFTTPKFITDAYKVINDRLPK
jgi:hypothetical protein